LTNSILALKVPFPYRREPVQVVTSALGAEHVIVVPPFWLMLVRVIPAGAVVIVSVWVAEVKVLTAA
jgi:hypothetical protein